MARVRVSEFVLCCALLLLGALPAAAAEAPRSKTWPGADLFTNGPARRLQIELGSNELASLRQNPREFVRAAVVEGNKRYSDVAVHLKGSTGSFRQVDDKPSLTLDFSRFQAGRAFHGLRRIHLNNSVEDPSYLNEWLGSEVFRAAGLPAPRVAHALVMLNGRSLGLYVLKEGFTEDFLACYFNQVGGDLYEPDEGHDIDEALKRVSVQAPHRDRGALKGLAAAALDPDLAERWQHLGEVLDVRRFVDFMALEVLLGHRDGYCLARNNFRVYYNLDGRKWMFLPHGMDQLLGKEDLPWQPSMAGVVAKAVMETPAGRKQYRAAFHTLFTNVFKAEVLTNHLEQRVTQLGASLSRRDVAELRKEAAEVQARLLRRQAALLEQLSRPEDLPLEFAHDVARLPRWLRVDAPTSGSMEEGRAPDGTPALHIATRADASASWRVKVKLGPGRYRFEGRARVAGVKPLAYGRHQGAGLRVAGGVRQAADLCGTSSWQPLRAEFQVAAASLEVELVCELRASGGEAWFDLDSLKLVRLTTQE